MNCNTIMETTDQEKQEEKQDKKDVLPVEEQLAECAALRDEYLNGWKRAKADLINYKKEESERAREVGAYMRQSFIYQLLPMLDNLEMTVKRMPQDLLENANVKGLLAVKTQLEDFLKANGVTPVESVGKKFDPNFHEIFQAVDVEGQDPGKIIEEVSKGYMSDGHLMRPAKVKVVK